MSNTNKEILAILRHYWKLGRNAVDVEHILREVEGHDAISDWSIGRYLHQLGKTS